MLTHHSVSGAWELKSDDDMYYHSKVSFFVSLLTALESTENDWNDWKFRSFCLEAYLILFLSVWIEIKKVFSFMMDLSSESSMDVLVQFVSNRLERALPYTHSFLCSQWAAERSDGRRESREKGVNEKRIVTGRAPADLSHGLHASLQLRVLWCVQDGSTRTLVYALPEICTHAHKSALLSAEGGAHVQVRECEVSTHQIPSPLSLPKRGL